MKIKEMFDVLKEEQEKKQPDIEKDLNISLIEDVKSLSLMGFLKIKQEEVNFTMPKYVGVTSINIESYALKIMDKNDNFSVIDLHSAQIIQMNFAYNKEFDEHLCVGGAGEDIFTIQNYFYKEPDFIYASSLNFLQPDLKLNFTDFLLQKTVIDKIPLEDNLWLNCKPLKIKKFFIRKNHIFEKEEDYVTKKTIELLLEDI